MSTVDSSKLQSIVPGKTILVAQGDILYRVTSAELSRVINNYAPNGKQDALVFDVNVGFDYVLIEKSYFQRVKT